MSAKALRVKAYVDGGSRGNPGPAGAGVLLQADDDGTALHEAVHFLGRTTNNVAEYKALIAALRAARDLGAAEVEAYSDSELLVRQMNGQYRVRNAGLAPLFAEAQKLAGTFGRFEIAHIPREQNAHADRLANQAMNCRSDVEDAAG